MAAHADPASLGPHAKQGLRYGQFERVNCSRCGSVTLARVTDLTGDLIQSSGRGGRSNGRHHQTISSMYCHGFSLLFLVPMGPTALALEDHF